MADFDEYKQALKDVRKSIAQVKYDTQGPNLDPLSSTRDRILGNTIDTNYTITTAGTNSNGYSNQYTNTTLGTGAGAYTFTYPPSSGIIDVKGDNADVKINGKSLKEFMEKVEEKLLILQPDPKKLEKYAALRKAYEHYKLLEKLIQED